MYSSKVINRNLDAFEASEGWRPIYHTLAEVEEYTAYIKSITKTVSNSKNTYVSVTTNLTEKREKEIRRWRDNERVLCSFDSNYFDTRYAYVCDEKGQIFKFQNRLSQKIFDSVIAEFDEKQVSIELLILKARQVGVTTKCALKFIHRMLFLPHTQSVMASVDSKKSELIGRILDTAHDFCPFWLVPIRTKDSQLAREYANRSVLSIQSGSQATGLAQGWTPTNIHVSELADLKDAKKTIEEGLLRATHSSRNLFMVLEGTGGGNTGWLADTWRTAKESWPSSRLCPIFIPWAMVPDLYPEPDWLRKFPIPDDWHRKISDITRKHVARCESYVRNTPYLAKVVGRDWRMPEEQKWFWQFNYDAACKNHTQKIWLAQMAADDFEALTGVHDTVFDPEVILEVEDNVYEVIGEGIESKKVRRTIMQAYAVKGHSIDETFYPDESAIDDSKPIISVTWKSRRGEEYDWELIPLLPINEDIEKNTFDRLLVYEEPRPGNDYACGVDTADGLDKEEEERACASISKVGTGSGYDEQVAELCLAQGSLVITKDNVKKIEDVNVGDIIVNRLGQYANVVSTKSSSKDESLRIFTGLSSNVPLHLTPDHKVAAAHGWVESSDLAIGDWLRYPVRPLTGILPEGVVIKGYNFRSDGKPTKRDVKDVHTSLNRDFGFMCGLYLAEGCVSMNNGKPRHVGWTLHERESGPWKEIIKRALPGLHVAEFPVKNASAHRLVISSKNLGIWFIDNFGRTSEKHVPSWVWDAPREFVEGLVHGMVAGDGGIDNRCASVVYASVLPSLSCALRDLVLSLGWGLGTLSLRPRINAQDCWTVLFCGEVASRFLVEDMIRFLPQKSKRRPSLYRWGWNKEWIYVKVKKIESASSGKFFDITVNGNDPSFCTIQAAVHNCSRRMNPAQMVPFVACMATWYGQRTKDHRGVKFAIEQVRGPGDTCQNQLKIMGFNYHHAPRRYDSKKIKDESKHKQGWYSNAWSVPMLMTSFVEAVNGGWYIPKSKWLIEECKTLERHITGSKSKMEHREGQFDDRVRAAAQSYFTTHDLDDFTQRSQKRYALPKRRQADPNEGRCTLNAISVGGDD